MLFLYFFAIRLKTNTDGIKIIRRYKKRNGRKEDMNEMNRSAGKTRYWR